ncbi:type II toxin-antitoxin system RatA family toxin [Streptomyces sp. NPDC048527]|uniref:type II toxin-antitoxin system RatA family toxin n=1 Tax=Streptomyces sp. NPDC048527 TaxID=3365568 RepID=UPI00371E1CB0
MRQFSLRAVVSDVSPDTAYERVRRFEEFVGFSDVIRSISVTGVDATTRTSAWEVNFYDGVMRWTERDVLDPATRSITFEQLHGDLAVFSGSWQVDAAGEGGTSVLFETEFDLGMPYIADVIDPIAVEAFDDTMSRLMIGLFGASIDLEVTVDGVVRTESLPA